MADSMWGIPAQVAPPQAPAGVLANPLGMVSTLADIRAKNNQNALFQQQFQANQEMGRMMASAPDPETGIKQIMSSPYAPFAGQFLNNYRAAGVALQDLQNKQLEYGKGMQEGVQNGFGTFMKLLPATANDPSRLDQIVKTAKGQIAPTFAGPAGAAIDGLASALKGVPPEKWRSTIQSWMATTGAPAETFAQTFGTPAMPDVGSGKQPGVQLPAGQGGQFVAAGPQLLTGVAPQVKELPGGGAQSIGGIFGGNGPQAGVPFRLPEVAGGPASPGGNDLAGSLSQYPNRTPAEELGNNEAVKDFYTNGVHNYQQAQAGLGQLSQINSDLDRLQQAGGLLTPGTAGELRLGMARAANTFASLLGAEKPPFNPNAVASGEEALKSTIRLGLMVGQSFLGGQREAAQTIQTIIKSVPGLENSYLGGKVLSDTLGALLQRQMDMHEFQQQYMDDHNGQIKGSDIAFNKTKPIGEYLEPIGQKYGIDVNTGKFNSLDDIKKAVASGLLTKAQALEIAKSQTEGK